MTIAVAVACPEGLVLAADSRTSTVGANGAFRVATDYAHKVFSIQDRFGAVTFGWAFLEGRSIAGVMEEFAAQTQLAENATIEAVAAALADYFNDRIDAHVAAGLDPEPDAGNDVLGFIVGGYDQTGVGQFRLVWLPSRTITPGAATNNSGAHWQGEVDVWFRLSKGFDILRLDTEGWEQAQLDGLAALEYIVRFEAMALQDAIDYAEFIVRTTVDMQRFSHGTVATPGSFPTCGGPVELATITRRGGLEWVRKTRVRAATPGRAEAAQE